MRESDSLPRNRASFPARRKISRSGSPKQASIRQSMARPAESAALPRLAIECSMMLDLVDFPPVERIASNRARRAPGCRSLTRHAPGADSGHFAQWLAEATANNRARRNKARDRLRHRANGMRRASARPRHPAKPGFARGFEQHLRGRDRHQRRARRATCAALHPSPSPRPCQGRSRPAADQALRSTPHLEREQRIWPGIVSRGPKPVAFYARDETYIQRLSSAAFAATPTAAPTAIRTEIRRSPAHIANCSAIAASPSPARQDECPGWSAIAN